MSLTSPPYYADDEFSDRHGSVANTKSSSSRSTPRLYDNQIVQEVSVSYSAPYTGYSQPHVPLALNIGTNAIDEYSRVFEENGNLHSYISDYEPRSARYPVTPEKLESVRRHLSSGRTETEFPVKKYGYTEEIPYFSAQSAIQSARTTPAQTPRATPVIDSRATTVRLPSSLSHNTIISESTTIEELTTITTANIRKSRKDEPIKSTDMPTVNALAEQFEATAKKEKMDALKSRISPSNNNINNNNNNNKNRTSPNQNSKSKTRVVVINKSNEYSNQYTDRIQPIFTPAGFVTTTIVDIEPPGYGRRARIEEYRMQEEYRSKQFYDANENYRQQKTPSQPAKSPRSREEAVEIFVRSQSRSGANSRATHERFISSDDTISQPSPTVRNVIEQFETRIESRQRTSPEKENIPRSVSRVSMNQDGEVLPNEVIISRREIEENTDMKSWKTIPTKVSPPTPTPSEYTQPSFIRTYEEERSLSIQHDGRRANKSRSVINIPPPETVVIPRALSPLITKTTDEVTSTVMVQDSQTLVTKDVMLEEAKEEISVSEAKEVVAEDSQYIIESSEQIVNPSRVINEPVPNASFTSEYTITSKTNAENDSKNAEQTAQNTPKNPESESFSTSTTEITTKVITEEEITNKHRAIVEEVVAIEPLPVEEPKPSETEPYSTFTSEYTLTSRTENADEWNKETLSDEPKKEYEPEEKETVHKKAEGAEEAPTETFRRIMEHDYRIKAQEEYTTTRRRRDYSLPSYYNRSPRMESYRTRSVERSYVSNSNVSRNYTESRHIGSGAALASGISTAGVICTTSIRDNREREKREIGLLNDRLADYIEKVRFLEAQNRILTQDIETLSKGFRGNGQISFLYDSEIKTAKSILEKCIADRDVFNREIVSLTAQCDGLKEKWRESVNVIKGFRSHLDVDLDKLAQIEAGISLYRRKVGIVEEDCIRIKRENDRIRSDIMRVRGQTHQEVSMKSEYSIRVQDLLNRVNHLQTENNTKIEQEMISIRRDTTIENRDYFRRELQAAINEIRADYEAIYQRNRYELEEWYRKELIRVQPIVASTNTNQFREEIVSIRSTLASVRQSLADMESRNSLLEKQIADLGFQASEDAKLYEALLSEKDAAIAKMKDQCSNLTIQMEKLCDHEISLRKEIEHYRRLLEGANVTTYVATSTYPSTRVNTGTSRVVQTSTVTKSSSASNYSNVRSGYEIGGGAGFSGSQTSLHVGGNIGGSNIIAGGNIHESSSSIHSGGRVTGGTSEPAKKPDRIHNETGTDEHGRKFHRYYKGTIRITQVQRDFIELENICVIRKVDVGGFRIEHTSCNRLLGQVTIGHSLILDPKQTLRIYTSRHPELEGDIIMQIPEFDVSTDARTSLYNSLEPEEERVYFVYTS
ncbi:unnamed protein product [Caenorhabditis bovis]|uniref:IF rod domain-containing protein n=1 Tax=Caenorhabditis bovis TaxID=2654633 RepID=A0A8S1ERV7_9PELO|nr:unnamed protein product [Caenorhabditis bovis]